MKKVSKKSQQNVVKKAVIEIEYDFVSMVSFQLKEPQIKEALKEEDLDNTVIKFIVGNTELKFKINKECYKLLRNYKHEEIFLILFTTGDFIEDSDCVEAAYLSNGMKYSSKASVEIEPVFELL